MLCAFLCFVVGCGSGWRGRIVHLGDGKVVLQPEGEGKIKSCRKILIYREKTIIHPVTGQVMGTIKDDIVETPVLWVRDRTVTATADEPYFSMMMVDDQAAAVRGSVKTMTGSVREVGKITEVNAEGKTIVMAVTLGETISPEDSLTVIRYSEIVREPDTGDFLAVAVVPVADLEATKVNADGQLRAAYSLMNEKLGWIEIDDVVVSRTGDMLTEPLWFQDPPDGFSEAWVFGRSYMRAIRHYDAGRYREAVVELNEVLQADPEYREAAYLLGLCYANLNRHEEAAAQFKKIAAYRSDDAKTWAALAYAHLKQGNLQEAAESYEKLARLLPGDSKVWMDIGDIYRMLDDPQKAKQAYKKALEINKNDEEAQYELLRK